MKVATGLATGRSASPDLVKTAVKIAMEKADIHHPTAVLLFLTSEFAADPESAIRTAAISSNCTQIVGCSASGIFTEEDWVLDSPAAAAMVFEGFEFHTVTDSPEQSMVLTLAAPNAINSTWLNARSSRFGGVSGDATGHGPFSVWQNGKGVTQGYCELMLQHARYAVGVTHGLKTISAPRKITQTNGYDLISINSINALNSVNLAWQKQYKDFKPLPYHQLIAIYASKATQLERGEYQLASIISGNEADNTITMSRPLQPGDWLSWAIRDVDAAQIDLVKTASTVKQQLGDNPDFAWLFSCLGRGPYFYNGGDQDLALLKVLFPQLPIIGFYGNGEIAPVFGKNEILQYSAVLALFANKLDHEPI